MEQTKKSVKNPEPVPDPFIFFNCERDEKLERWDFNVMDCGPLEQHRVLYVMFKNLNLFAKYKINMSRFPDFIHEVKYLYNFYGNSYHNYEHGINRK